MITEPNISRVIEFTPLPGPPPLDDYFLAVLAHGSLDNLGFHV